MAEQPPDIEIRSESADQAERFLDFIAESMGRTGNVPLGADYWTWKHVENPFGTSPVLTAHAATSDGDRLAGLRVFMRWSWRSGGEALPSVRAVDTATHPDFRGRGIFRTLTLQLVDEMRGEGIPFVYNTPNEMSRPGYLKMGWEEVGRVPLLLRPVRPVRLALRVLRQRLGTASAPPEAPSPAEAARWGTVRDLCAHAGLVETLTAPNASEHRYATARSGDYLRWRYDAIPDLAYHAVWDTAPGREHAVIFRLRSRRGVRELSLSDVLVRPGAERAARQSVRRLMKEADVDYAAAVAAPDTPERRALVRLGFVPARRIAPILTARAVALDAGRPSPFEIENWRLSTGDIELF